MRRLRLPLSMPSGGANLAVPSWALDGFMPAMLRPDWWTRHDRGAMSDGAGQFTSANSQYLSLSAGASDTYNVPGVPFSIAGWMYRDSAGVSHQILSKYNNANGGRVWTFQVSSGNLLGCRLSNDGTAANGFFTTNALATSTWYFVGMTYDLSNVVLHLYSTAALVERKTTAYASGVVNDTNNRTVLIGAYNPSAPLEFMNGRIDALGFWKNRVLSNADFDALWNSGAGATYGDLTDALQANLHAWWNLNEATGTRADWHVNAHHATASASSPTAAVGIRAGAAGDEDAISQWRDDSLSANHASQATAAKRLTYELSGPNGRASLVADGVDDFLTLASAISAGGEFTAAWVSKIAAYPSTILGHSSGTSDHVRQQSATTTVLQIDATARTAMHASVSGAYAIHILTRDAGNNLAHYVNGAASTGLSSLSGTMAVDQIGMQGASTTPLNGEIVEALFKLKQLTTPELNRLGRYWAGLFGITWSAIP